MQIPETSPPAVPLAPRKNTVWSKIGGGSLMFAVLFHVLLLILGAFWIFQIVHEPEKKVDFMPPGGGGGPRGADVQVQQKKQAQITPVNNVKRVFAQNAVASYVIPEQGTDFGEMSSLNSLSGGGGMGGGGLGGSGLGKGFGPGKGLGGGMGNGIPKGIKLFGLDLKVQSIGVVLDVSRSMTPRLKNVVDEVNRVAGGSPVIMQFGCGIGARWLTDQEDRKREIFIEPVSAPRDGFKKFWYWYQADAYRNARPSERDNVDVSGPIPSPDVYNVFAERPKTFYHDRANTTTTADALLSKELKNVEAIYWFADFEDEINPEAAAEVLKILKRQKQKLYIHASKQGQHISAARDLLAIPSGGGEIKPVAP